MAPRLAGLRYYRVEGEGCPRVEPGSYVGVDPRRPPQPGDVVAVAGSSTGAATVAATGLVAPLGGPAVLGVVSLVLSEL